MTHKAIMFDVDLTSPASAETVLAAITSKAAYWQESMIPPDLRRIGGLGVRASVKGSNFELLVEDFGRDPPPTTFVLRGKVTPMASGGSRIQAWPAKGRSAWTGAVMFVVLSALFLWSGQRVLGALLLVGCVVMATRVPVPRATDVGVHHLVERLCYAIQAVSQPTSSSVI